MAQPLPSFGVGTWAWGDTAYWGPSARASEPVIEAFLRSVEAGVTLFDTAEVYGHGASEKSLGVLLERSGAQVQVATKFAPLPGRGGASAVLPALRASLARLRLPRVALYQVHWADHDVVRIPDVMDAMADAVELGLAETVGVSNFSAHEMREAHAVLARRGIALAGNQVRYSLLARDVERDGVLAACGELGVPLLAYEPLAQGILAGKYGVDAKVEGRRGRTPAFSRSALAAAQPVVALLREIGEKHGKAPEQVAINWLRAKPGVVVLAGARDGAQALRNAGALAWTLSPDDVARLDASRTE